MIAAISVAIGRLRQFRATLRIPKRSVPSASESEFSDVPLASCDRRFGRSSSCRSYKNIHFGKRQS